MITEEGWLELVEVSTPPTNASSLSFPSAIGHKDTAIHIYFSRNDGTIPLTSVVLESSISPQFISEEEQDKENDNDSIEGKGNYESSRSILLRLHPVLFMFLHHASRTNNMPTSEIQANEIRNDEQLSSPSVVPAASEGRDLDVRVQLGPLPMLEFQFVQATAQQQQQQSKQESSWKCRPVKVGKLKRGSEIFLSCVYVEKDDQWLSERNHDNDNDNDNTSGNNPKNRMPVDQVISTSLEGRIVSAGAVLLLSTMYGYVVATITNIIEDDTESIGNLVSDGNQSGDATYRLSDNVLDDYECHIEAPILSHGNNNWNQFQVDKEITRWERDIPGYEAPLEETIEIFRVHGDAAAASGVVVTGCAGVGKSRLASCVACHYSETGNFNKRDQQQGLEAPHNISSLNQKIYYSSVQDLIFQASVETNLLENVLVPKLRGCALWVIDDLNLLENEAGDGDEVRNNAEIVMVQNALVEAMDRFHRRCCILGIAQCDTNLPSEFTKSGRLEKTVQMLPPTQLQRMEIWKYILAHDTNVRSLLNSASANANWIVTLASSTAGCVPKDLLRIYRDAHFKVQARKTQSCESPSVLEWEDLRDAIKSTTPSQLSELDVIRPTIFDEGVSWKEIHLRSWQNFGGYPLLKKSVYRQVVVPWRYFLQSLDESLSEDIVENEKTWLEPPPGILFHGISGTGKTVAAKCLAVSLGLPIIQVRATDLLDKWLGGSESLLRSLFTRARTVSPCILFLDEIDAIACNREEDDNNDVSSRILSTLLNEMDGVSSAIRKSRVLVIACTNRIRSIDSALLRPGRLQEHFHLGNPDISDLEEILRLRMSKMPVDQNLVLNKLASKLFDIKATGADVEGLCREATFVAMRRVELHEDSDVAVSLKDFESAIVERFGNSQYVYQ